MNGDIQYLGRIDQQVKIRGFRIELGEIEKTLDQHPAVQQNVVVVKEIKSGEKQLVAYIIPRPKSLPLVNELRSYLRVKLPEYMVPTAFVILENFPITSNGKIDRQKLPTPEPTASRIR